jgi:tetratricopeptide (TPR) repeat protein
LVAQAAATIPGNPTDLQRVITALEGAGKNPRAIDLLEQSIAQNPSQNTSADSLDRLASLLAEQHRNVEAESVLEQLMHCGASVGVQAQAGERLLALSVATGTVSALIEKLRGRLDDGSGTSQDLSLLVDAFARAGDLNSAASTLRQSKLLDEPTRLARLAVLYLRARQFDDAEGVLKQLVTADPDNAAETLERLASVELSRNRPDQVAHVIDELRARVGEGAASDEIMAGALDRLGRPDEAATAYRHALELNPQNADDWLLWATAMAKAKRGTQAINRLRVLCGETDSDTVFATAADGLLNLNAPRSVLRMARRDAILRAAKRPDSAILLHVIADLSDEMQDPAMVVSATDASVSLSGEERTQRLRELMDVASQKGATDTAAECGRTLLALGDEFPPQLFLQLSEQLMISGRLADASRAVDRASESSDPDLIGPRAAALYEKYDYPSAALDVLRPIADRRKNDPGFRETMGRLSEINGKNDQAFENYLGAAALLAPNVAADQTRPAPALIAAGSSVTPLSQPGAPPSMAVTFNHVITGAIATARTEDQRAAITKLLKNAIDPLVADADPARPPTNGLTTLAAALRRVSFAFAVPDLADAVDEAIIARCPDSNAFAHQSLDARGREGFVARAAAFAIKHHLDPGPAVTAGMASVAGASPTTQATTQPTAPTVPANLTPGSAAVLLPALIARGQFDQARAILAAVPTISTPRSRTVQPAATARQVSPMQTMVAAAAALNDHEAVTRWSLIWLRSDLSNAPGTVSGLQTVGKTSVKSPAGAALNPATAKPAGGSMQVLPAPSSIPFLPGGGNGTAATGAASGLAVPGAGLGRITRMDSDVSTSPFRVVATVWPLLDGEGRGRMADFLIERAGQAGDSRTRAGAAMAALQVAAAESRPIPNAIVLADAVFDSPGLAAAGNAARVIALMPIADRPAVLLRAMERVAPGSRLSVLTDLVAMLDEGVDDSTRNAIMEAARGLRSAQNFEWSDWFMNRKQAPLLPELAAAVVRCCGDSGSPDAGAALTAAAAALRIAGDQQADATAIQAIQSLRVPADPADRRSGAARMPGQPRPQRGALLRMAVAVLSPDARSRMLAQAQAEAGSSSLVQSDRVWDGLLRAELLGAGGQRSEALIALRDTFRVDPSNVDVLNAYMNRLQDDGRNAELFEVLGQRNASSDGPVESALVQQANRRALAALYRWREQRTESDQAAVTVSAVDIAAQAQARDVSGLAASLRILLQNLRCSRPAPEISLPEQGGLLARAEKSSDRLSKILSQFPQLPGSVDDLIASVAIPREPATSRSTDVDSLATNLLCNASGNSEVTARLLRALGPAAAAHLLNAGQRRIVTDLAMRPEVNVPAEWISELWPAAMADDTGTELENLGHALAARHLGGADDALRWSATLEALAPRSSTDGAKHPLPSPLDTIDDASLSVELAAALEKDPVDTEAWLANARSTGRLGMRALNTDAIWARSAAQRGDLPEFEDRIDDLMHTWVWQRICPAVDTPRAASTKTLDLRSTLPATPLTSECRGALLAVLSRELDALAAVWPGDTDITRQFASLGDWALQQGDRDAAVTLCNRAMTLGDSQGLGEHRLWAADLARKLDQEPMAVAIETSLLQERCLPAPRMAGVLDWLKRNGQTEIAERLRADAISYCREPGLGIESR